MRRRGKRGNGGLTQRPNGKWQAQWSTTEGGRRVRKTATFALKGDAEWWLRQAKRGEAPDVDLTVGEYLEHWLGGKRKVRASTLALYRSHVETHIVPALGRISITALTPRHVEAFVSELQTKPRQQRRRSHGQPGEAQPSDADVSRAVDVSARRLRSGSAGGDKRDRIGVAQVAVRPPGRPLAASTIRGILTTLRAALQTGVRKRELPDNAALGIEAPSFRPPTIVPMTSEEVVGLLAATDGHWLQPLVRFLLGSSLRIGEALALNQADIHAGYVQVWESKTEERPVPVSADGLAALAEAIRLAPRRGPREPVFFGVKGDRLTRSVVSRALPRLLLGAGLQRRTAHQIRHGSATLMLSAGVPMRVIAEQLGHKSERMTRRYAHVTPSLQRLAVDTLDDAVRKG